MENLQIICSLISNFMNLDNKHCYIYNQKWIIPTDNSLFICVGFSGTKILSNNSYHKTIDGVYSEILEVQK